MGQKSGWWNCPTIILRQTGHSNSDTTMVLKDVVRRELLSAAGDGDASSAVKYEEEEEEFEENDI